MRMALQSCHIVSAFDSTLTNNNVFEIKKCTKKNVHSARPKPTRYIVAYIAIKIKINAESCVVVTIVMHLNSTWWVFNGDRSVALLHRTPSYHKYEFKNALCLHCKRTACPSKANTIPFDNNNIVQQHQNQYGAMCVVAIVVYLNSTAVMSVQFMIVPYNSALYTK